MEIARSKKRSFAVEKMKIFLLLPIAGTYSQVQLRMAKGKKRKVHDEMFLAPSGELYKPSDCGVDGNGEFKILQGLINYKSSFKQKYLSFME